MKFFLLLLAIFLLAFSAKGAIIYVSATGTLVGVDDSEGILPFTNLVIGTTQFTLNFSYDDTTSGIISSDGSTGLYLSAVKSMTLDVDSGTNGQVDISFPLADGNLIGVQNDAEFEDGRIGDQWFAGARNADLEQLSFHLASDSPSTPVPPLTSALLLPPVFPSGWEIGLISFNILEEKEVEPAVFEMVPIAAATAQVFFVPVPAAAWLFMTSLGFLASHSWNRQRTIHRGKRSQSCILA